MTFALLSIFSQVKINNESGRVNVKKPRADQRRPLAGARGFFYGKSQLPSGADRKTRVAIHPRSGERARESALGRAGYLAFSREEHRAGGQGIPPFSGNYGLLLANSKGGVLKVNVLLSVSANDGETFQMPISC